MEKMVTVCKNPWCKGHFYYTEADMVELKSDTRSSKIEGILDEVKKFPPTQCPKCRSFQTELSGGIEWKDKEYEGPRFDGTPHQMNYRVTNYKL